MRNHSVMLLTGMSLKVKSGGEIKVKSKNLTCYLRKYTRKMKEEQEYDRSQNIRSENGVRMHYISHRL